MALSVQNSLRVGCRLHFDIAEAGPLLLNVAPVTTARQHVLWESLRMEPELAATAWNEPGRRNQLVRARAPVGPLVVFYEAEVVLGVPRGDGRRDRPGAANAVEDYPMAALPYLRPSRYCPSDRLGEFARSAFGRGGASAARIARLSRWIRRNVAYLTGTSDAQTTALDTLDAREGVCRDFAHLAIALCRALDIPARYVTGYAHDLDPPDFHAVVECYCDGEWRLFDPTGRTDPRAMVRIGTGYDAAEVPFATLFGTSVLVGMEVFCHRDTAVE